jgi:hypothetical protein
MKRIFIKVPKPGFSRSGHHNKRTSALIPNVARPIGIPVCALIPCAKTDQGAFPICESMRQASPNPNIKRPKIKIDTRLRFRSHRPWAVQEVLGIVREGLKKCFKLCKNEDSLTVRVYLENRKGWLL